MGVRNLYSIDVDKVTGKIAAAWVGPDQGTNSTTWGPAKTENAVVITSAGNYGWPFCTGNQQGYRAKLPATTGGGLAAPTGHPGTVAGNDAATTGGGGYWDCDDPQGILNTSPFNTGLERIPAARPTNIWYGPQGGCYDFARNDNGIPAYNGTNTAADTNAAGASYRRCPFVFGGSQAPMTGGFYRKPAGDQPNAWPSYWEGRWFVADYAGSNNIRHAMLMDPATESTGGQPIAADSLYAIIPTPRQPSPTASSIWTSVPTARCTSPTTADRTSRSATPTTRSAGSPTSAGPTHRVRTRRSTRTRTRPRRRSRSTSASRAASRTSGTSRTAAPPPARTSPTRTSARATASSRPPR